MRIQDFALKYNLPTHEVEGLKDRARFWARENLAEKLLIFIYCQVFGMFPGGYENETIEEEILQNIRLLIQDELQSANTTWSSVKIATFTNALITNLSTALQNLFTQAISEEASIRENDDLHLSNNLMAVINNEATARILNDAEIVGQLNDHKSNISNPHSVTKEQIGLGSVIDALQLTVLDILTSHTSTATNKAASAYSVKQLADQIHTINEILSSDDVDLDTLQEIVNLIKENAVDLATYATGKVNVSDIVNDTDSEIANKPASAGTVFRLNVDKANKSDTYTKSEVDTALGGKRNSGNIPAAEVNETTSRRFVSDAEKDQWNNIIHDLGNISGSVAAISLNAKRTFKATLTGNVTFSEISGGSEGNVYLIRLKQDATGGRTVTLPSNIIIPSLETPDLGANKRSLLTVYKDETDFIGSWKKGW
ncbi:hypothetical protein EHQ16_03295 [Leptospira kanakyensis]|uniref:Uncharacterized protein n=1 Tax=Leptospira kanakyensis TaxID=2484968 RepID=A0A6N4Q9J2_9LEPT|nr:hypothetical protein [Leptospira kanakyensis]TGK47505.1 hypothetical protein EHQ11_16335 [Leptospira kanakyensis]TGK63492.1 hypothetical protein EHQ16_03295 [Leptospira kanakyensis]TGK67096.1 hypothetical protein EHQ18_18535 [Leptospira kanakyensis]